MSRIVATPKRSGYVALAIALVIQTGLISIQVIHRFDTGLVRSWVLDSLAPVEKMSDRSFYGIAYLWDHYFFLIGLHKQNEQLKTQLNDVRMRFDKQEQDVREVQRLRAMLALRDSIVGQTIVARVIGRDPTRTNETITIDK